MRRLRATDGPGKEAPEVFPAWNLGELVIREVTGEQPYFRVVKAVEGERWTSDPVVTLQIPDTGVSYKGLLWSSVGQARILKYKMSEALERYRHCPEAVLEEPF